MKHKKNIYKLTTALLFISSVYSLPAIANDTNESIGIGGMVKLGTLGPGIELDFRLNESWNIRLQANSYNFSDTFEEDDIEYTGEIDLSSYGALIDWRPFSGAFRLTGGVFSNSNELSGTAVSRGNEIFEIGDIEYQGSENDPLTLNTSVKLGSSTAGYLGLGWENNTPSGWLFSFEVGVLLSGAPEVELNVDGSAQQVNNPGILFDVNGSSPEAQELKNEINREVDNLEDDISDFEFYPVIALGIGYRF